MEKPYSPVCKKTKTGLFFWYGLGENTFYRPTDLETAKTQAEKHYEKNKDISGLR